MFRVLTPIIRSSYCTNVITASGTVQPGLLPSALVVELERSSNSSISPKVNDSVNSNPPLNHPTSDYLPSEYSIKMYAFFIPCRNILCLPISVLSNFTAHMW